MSSDLLPPNATTLERQLTDTVTHTDEKIAPLPAFDLAPVSALWKPVGPDVDIADGACPKELLPWLAWAEQVPEWSSREDWSEYDQRKAIADAREIRHMRGTPGALKHALEAIGLDAKVTEWFQQDPPADPYTFSLDVELSERGLDAAKQARIERVVNESKNVRSHWTMTMALKEQGTAYYGSTYQSGDLTTIYPLLITELVESGQLLLAYAAYDAETTTLYPLTV